MADRLEMFSADPVVPVNKNQSQFPWTLYEDGSIWRAEQGKDYESQRGFLSALTKRAKKAGKVLRIVRHEGAVEFVFEPGDDVPVAS